MFVNIPSFLSQNSNENFPDSTGWKKKQFSWIFWVISNIDENISRLLNPHHQIRNKFEIEKYIVNDLRGNVYDKKISFNSILSKFFPILNRKSSNWFNKYKTFQWLNFLVSFCCYCVHSKTKWKNVNSKNCIIFFITR